MGKIPTGETRAYTMIQMTHENGRNLHKEKENLRAPFESHLDVDWPTLMGINNSSKWILIFNVPPISTNGSISNCTITGYMSVNATQVAYHSRPCKKTKNNNDFKNSKSKIHTEQYHSWRANLKFYIWPWQTQIMLLRIRAHYRQSMKYMCTDCSKTKLILWQTMI